MSYRELLIAFLLGAAACVFGLAICSTAGAEKPPCVGDRHENCVVIEEPGESGTCGVCRADFREPDREVIHTNAAYLRQLLRNVQYLIEVEQAHASVSCPFPTPDREFPRYVPCRRKQDGTLKCPRPGAPRRVLVPEGDAR